MSWWNAKYTNSNGEYEITFASKDYEKAKAVEKVCCAIIDKNVKSLFDVEVVVRCRECKHLGVCGDATNLEVMGFYGYCSRGERKEGADYDI